VTHSQLVYHNQASTEYTYGVATISRLLKITRLFCRISSLGYGSFAKETYYFREPTHRSHPISDLIQPIAFRVPLNVKTSNLNRVSLCSTERGKRDHDNSILDSDLRLKKLHSKEELTLQRRIDTPKKN